MGRGITCVTNSREVDDGEIECHLSVKMTKEQMDTLTKICKIEKRPKSWVVRELLVKWMEGYPLDGK